MAGPTAGRRKCPRQRTNVLKHTQLVRLVVQAVAVFQDRLVPVAKEPLQLETRVQKRKMEVG